MLMSPLKNPKPEQSTEQQQVESIPKNLTNWLLLKPVDASVVQGLKLKPVAPSEVAHLVRKAKVKSDTEAEPDLTNGNQGCLDDSLLDDILGGSEEPDKVSDHGSDSKPLIVEENECKTCLKQFVNKANLNKHKEKGDCMQIICKREHDHKYKIVKFGSAGDALAFGKSFGKTRCKQLEEQKARFTCRETGCPAHWSFKETRRPSAKVDYVFRGCLAHGLNCRHHESNLQKTKKKTQSGYEYKLRKDYLLQKIFPNWESAMQYFRDNDQDLIFSLHQIKRDSYRNVLRKYYCCSRRGKHKQAPTSEHISKKIGCTASCIMRKTSKGVEFAGNFKHNHEEFEGARRRGGGLTSNPKVAKKRMCDKCGVLKKDGGALSIHVKAVHEKLKPFLCSECPYVASTNGNLKKHVKNIHKKIIPYKCEQCPYAAEFKVDLRKHVQKFHQDRKKKPKSGAEATEMCIRELDNIRAKLLSGEMDKSDLLDLSDFVVKMKGTTQEGGRKRNEPDFGREGSNSDHQSCRPNKLRKIRKPNYSDEKSEGRREQE